MGKKILLLVLLCISFVSVPVATAAEEPTLAQRLSGKILLQVESYGRAWYVYPANNQRYYLKDRDTAFEIMRTLSLGITDKDLAKIPERPGQKSDPNLTERLKGRILLQVQQNGEAWYVNPSDGIRYYMKDGQAAYTIMRNFSLGISNDNLRTIPMNTTQIVHDTTFDDIAYVKYDGKTFTGGYNQDQILPLASMSKLMTALVFLETNPSWNERYTLTSDNILYPKLYVGDDTTSEVNFAVGDTVSLYDLWAAMLVSSSNQAASALADASGLPRHEFIKKMNEKANKLGLIKTVFYDVAGLDSHNVTTVKEMAVIAREAFNKQEIVNGANENYYTIAATTSQGNAKEISIINRNKSLQQFDIEAAKVGYLIEAQRTVALKKGADIIVVMHAKSMSLRDTAIEKLISF